MNAHFEKSRKTLAAGNPNEQAKEELHKTFATLTQEEQKYANISLHNFVIGDITADGNKTIRD